MPKHVPARGSVESAVASKKKTTRSDLTKRVSHFIYHWVEKWDALDSNYRRYLPVTLTVSVVLP